GRETDRVRWPQTIAAGTASHETVCLIDLIATCADVIGDVLPDNVGEDSVSNLLAWCGESIPTSLREATVHSSVNGSLAIRQGQWKLEMCPGSGGWSYPKPGVETDGLPPLQLYDLATDIGETANVAADHPDIVESLTDLLTRYITQGRSTPGEPQQNEGGSHWTQLWWMAQE
ncbi:MAG: arylsulfatase, partial [Chloroflexota bacterium]